MSPCRTSRPRWHSSFSDLQWVVDAYALTLAAFLLTAGSLADMYGRRLLYLIGLGVFTVASLLCGAAQATLMLQLSRAVQGVGGAIMFSVSLALLANAFRGKDRGIAFGVWGAITGLAVAIGPLLGGILTSGLSWRWIFFVNLPIGIAAIALTAAKVAESRDPRARRPDWAGFALVHPRAGEPGLRAHRVESALVQRRPGDRLLRRRRRAAGRVRSGRVADRIPMFDLSLFRLPTFSGGVGRRLRASAPRSSRCSCTWSCTCRTSWGSARWGPAFASSSYPARSWSTSAIAGRLTSRVPVRLLIGPGLAAGRRRTAADARPGRRTRRGPT